MILESFVCNWIDEVCPDSDDELQFGCRKGTSTTHCLIELIHHWSTATDTTAHYVRILMLDFSKAFEHIDHEILLSKWRQSETPELLLDWKYNFLLDRQQRVKIKNCVSSWKSPDGSTPQGTLSGPKDFKQIVKDMKATLPLYKYVDDTTSFEICERKTPSQDLQKSADMISDWCQTNKIIINEKKNTRDAHRLLSLREHV